jgi:NADH-quinone oxidoreductase subunit C
VFQLKLKNKLKPHRRKRLIAIVCNQDNDFILDYYFDANGKITKVRVKLPKTKPIIESIADIFPSADYFEREIHEFFDVEFEGNKKLHLNLFLPDNWKGKPPLRR